MARLKMSKFQRRHRFSTILTFFLFLSVFLEFTGGEWLNHGRDITNERNAVDELLISPRTVSRLRQRWQFFAGKDVSATPAVADGVIYFPSWNGYLYAVHALTGTLVWQQNLSQLTGLKGTGNIVNVTVSRSTPTIAGGIMMVPIYGPAYVIAVSRSDGSLVWMTRLDANPLAVITCSGTVFMGGLHVGVSSLEETLPAGQCCTFRGSMVRLDVLTGKVQWQTYTLPDNGGRLGGYAGAAIWGSSPSIDPIRRHVYAATGNLYIAPGPVLACQARRDNQTSKPPTHPDQCIGPDVHYNSMLAFDIDTGKIAWATRLGGYDVFYFACLVPNNPDCPPGPNLDADFGEAPMVLSVKGPDCQRLDLAVAVQKSGFAWALHRDNGSIFWSTLAGPGSNEGGGTWGAATDGKRVYTNIANGARMRFTLQPSSATTTAGAWVALDAITGEILWSTANPSNDTANGPVSVANGVVFAGSVAPNGPIYGMDASTGRVLWTAYTGATVYGGISISYGCAFVGSGYKVGVASFHPTWTAGTSVFSYCLF